MTAEASDPRTEWLTRSVGMVRPAGWAMAIVLVAAWAAAALWDWREAAVIAVFAACLLAVAPGFVVGRYRLAAAFELSESRVVVGEPATGSIVVTNRGHRVAPSATVHMPVGRSRADFDLPRLPSGAEHDELFTVPTSRRTVLTVGPVETVRADPFGLLERRQPLTGARDLFVHPATVAVHGSAAGLMRDLEGRSTRVLADNDMSFHALRDYVPGDDRRNIHWRHSARTGGLVVRQFEQTRRSHLVVVLSTRTDDYADAEEFELAVSIAGSVGIQVLRDQQSATAMTSTAPVSTVTAHRYLDALSGVDLVAGAEPLSTVVRRRRADLQSASVVVLITGSEVETRDLRRAHGHLPPDVQAMGVIADPGAPTSIRPLGAIDVVSVARLPELSTAFARPAR